MRRLAVVACAFGLLLALPVSTAAAKVIDVPGTAVFRAANNGAPNCTAWVYIQWPAQANAQAWELDYEYLRGTGNHLTHQKVTLSPPFGDTPHSLFGWAPPAGHHWYSHTYRSKSAPGKTVECESLEGEMLAKVLSATLHITVPDDEEAEDKGPSCSALKARERRLQRQLKTARKGERRARNRFKAAKKRVRVANRRLKRKRATGPRSAALKAEEAKQRAVQARTMKRQIARDAKKAATQKQKTIKDTRTSLFKLCSAN